MMNWIKNIVKEIGRLLLWMGISCLLISLYQVFYFKYFSPVMTYKMYTNKLGLLFSNEQDKKIYYEWVDLKNTSGFVPLAVVAAEDQKFPQHYGLDYEAISKAFTYNRKGGQIKGGSTISQQVAKNLFLWPGRSFLRKGIEVYYTFLIEMIWGKSRILEMYINIAEMGPNTYGIGAASQKYWNKKPSQIDRYEASILAAVLPNPLKMSAQRPSNYVIKRREWIMKQMNQLGGLNYLKTVTGPDKKDDQL